MLDIVRSKLPDVDSVRQDMINFQVRGHFDVIVSLFSAISYVKTLPRLKQVLSAINRHLKPGGVTIIEPWFSPEEFTANHQDAQYGELKDFKACRMREWVIEGRIARIIGHFMIASDSQVSYFQSPHEFGLFTVEEISNTIADVGLQPHYIEEGLTGIGLHVGLKPKGDGAIH
jgi:SAM-dependent methyltransferase